MSFIDRINACNNADTAQYLPFIVGGKQAGWVSTDFANKLSRWPELFIPADGTVNLAANLQGFDERTTAVDTAIRYLADQKQLRSYLDEPYPVTAGDRKHAMMTIDRGAVPYFGIRSFGQHLNGYVRKADGIHLWIARRARDRLVEPGKLDNMVAGGLPWHTSLHDNLLKECAEEAGMRAELAATAVAVGTVSYLAESAYGIKPDTLYCYDIELPDNFVPVCSDGEVESFELMHIDRVREIVHDTEEFKPNCNLVIIDFMIRHGLLDPAQEQYAELVSRLHRRL
jgi:8-oxo-dGTP pyrophosphatase MutT (NUDIX family)